VAHVRPEAVGEAAALVPDSLTGANVLVGVGVGGLVDGRLERGRGDDLHGLGPGLDADAHALVGPLHEEGDLLRDVDAPAAEGFSAAFGAVPALASFGPAAFTAADFPGAPAFPAGDFCPAVFLPLVFAMFGPPLQRSVAAPCRPFQW